MPDPAAAAVVDPPTAPYDALLVVSFGGPEQPSDVMPFLENVTRGRGIPRDRLAAVAHHYDDFGGRSPINDQCRALLAALRTELESRSIDLPLYWGNRNWDPFLGPEVERIVADGHRRVVAVLTSAYPSYSSCRQYRENLFDAFDAFDAQSASGVRSTRSATTPTTRASSPPRSTPPTPRSTSWESWATRPASSS